MSPGFSRKPRFKRRTSLAPPPVPTGLIYQHDFEDGAFPTQGGVIPSALSTDITVSTVNPISGTRSFNVRYNGTAPGTAQWQEHNIALPKCYGGFGMEWDTRFSSNFFLRPDGGGGNNTSKWFQFWQQTDANYDVVPRTRSDYTGIFATGASIRRNGVGDQIEVMGVVTSPTGDIASNIDARLLIDPTAPANAPIKPGQIHNVKWRVKFATGVGTADGYYELLVDNVLVIPPTNFDFYPPNRLGPPVPFVSWGYFMGYSNGGFTNTTDVQWDNLKIYNTTTRWW